MATSTVHHVELININDNGNLDIMYPKNTSNDVTINPGSGTAAKTAIGSDTKILAKLIDKFGTLGFTNQVEAKNLKAGLMTTSTSITTANTYIADAVAVKNLNTALNTLKAKTFNVSVSGDTLVLTTNT